MNTYLTQQIDLTDELEVVHMGGEVQALSFDHAREIVDKYEGIVYVVGVKIEEVPFEDFEYKWVENNCEVDKGGDLDSPSDL